MGLFGFDDVGDMFDGGGAGGSGDTFSTEGSVFDKDGNNDYAANGGKGAQPSIARQVKGTRPTGLKTYTTVGMVGRVMGWANGNKKTDVAKEVDGRQVYTNDDNKQYSYNRLGLPYEVSIQNGKVVDTLSIRGEDGLNGYERNIAAARAQGDNAAVEELEKAKAANEEDSPTSNVDAAVARYRAISKASGVEVSNEDIQALIADPNKFLGDKGINLSDLTPQVDPNAPGTILNPDDPRYTTSSDVTYNTSQVDAAQVQNPNFVPVASATTDTSADRLNNPQYNVDPQTGRIRDENLVDADALALDVKGAATGQNADGTINYTGLSLNDYASQNISMMIDTSTAAGKLLAAKLGDGNYTDTKSTILGQMEVLSSEFKTSSGEPKIPPWAQSIYRNTLRTISFNGVSGSAALAASANAIMEATLPIAESEAKFFQTVTLANLDNRQQSVINKAKTLASFDMENLSVRSAAAIENAKAFLQLDLTNLDNKQQSEVVNVQSRVDAMFTDVAEENVNRRLNIQNEIANRQFYDTLQQEAATFNATAINATRNANANRSDAASQFNIERVMARDQFEANMARIIDESNFAWRREVYTTNTKMEFEAAAVDVGNALSLTTEGMNRLWDRVDSQLDYIWKSTEADEQRDFDLLLGEMQAAAAAESGKASARGSILGAIAGGAARGLFSDERLKDNIQYQDTLPNGVNVYSWEWNDTAKVIGADQTPPFGVIAQEVIQTHPDAVRLGEDGFLRVDYGMIQ